MAVKTSEALKFSIDNLHSAAWFVTHVPEIKFQQFQNIIASFFDLDPDLLILEWQPIVKNADRQSFELFAQENGMPNFFIWEPDILGEPTPVGVRDEYVPVYLMRSRYPEADDIDTLGLDLAWSPERMDSKWLARDTGLAQSSYFFPILPGPGSNMAPMGFAITLPVYEGGDLPTNQVKRREKAIGYLAGVYELALLLGNELDQLKAKGINLRLSDASGNVYQVDFEGDVPSEFSHEFNAQFIGKTWTFDLTAKEAMGADLKGFEFY